MFTELKETIFKEIKERILTVLYQMENTNKEREIFLKRTKWNYRVKSTITEIKNLLEGINNRFELPEEKNGKLEDRLIEIM